MKMPRWMLIAALINGAFETFLMLYIFVAIQNQGLMLGAWLMMTTYLILLGVLLIVGLMVLAVLRQQNMTTVIAQIGDSVALTDTTSQLIHLAGLISVGLLTVIAGLAGRYLPAMDENPLL